MTVLRAEAADASARSERASRPTIPSYDLVRPIGAGRFGTVHLAIETLTGARRAVKVIPRRDAAAAGVELDGVRRYQSCAHQHPHLIQLLTVGATDTHLFYVMELADDAGDEACYVPTTLRTLMRRQGIFEGVDALRWIAMIADGVAHLHSQQLRHNDLKPENILVVGGAPRIADVGLADSFDGSPRGGTPGYVTPEGATSDTYALGMMLYELITGNPPGAFPEPSRGPWRKPTRESIAANALALQACHTAAPRRLASAERFLSEVRRALRPRSLSRRLVLLGGMGLAAGAFAVGASTGLRFWPARAWHIDIPGPDGRVYTRLAKDDVRIAPGAVRPGDRISVRFRYELAATAGHHVVAAVAMLARSEARILGVFLDAEMRPGGMSGSAVIEAEVPGIGSPDEAVSSDLVAIVGHVKTVDDLRTMLAAPNPATIWLGRVTLTP